MFNKVRERPVNFSDHCKFVVDGGNLFPRVVWSKHVTFPDIYSAYFNITVIM